MSRSSFNELIGQKTKRALLFADGSQEGWIESVPAEAYPKLDELLKGVDTQDPVKDSISGISDFNTCSFRFPKSLDDFGMRNWLAESYGDMYAEYSNNWSEDRSEIVKEQAEIFEQVWESFPVEYGCYLYFMVSEETGVERVVYVGKQFAKSKSGSLRKRYLHHVKYNPNEKTDNWIGDCINKPSIGPGYLGIRVKSAELRRRGVSKVYWADLMPALSKKMDTDNYQILQGSIRSIEDSFITKKMQSISAACDAQHFGDPINEK